MGSVVAECARILKPDGVLLATLPCASRVCVEYGYGGDCWRLTEAGAQELFAGKFSIGDVEIRSRGNVLVNAAFLYGLSIRELTEADFEPSDPYFPLLVTVRARKASRAGRRARGWAGAADATKAAVLLYHRVSTAVTDVHGLSVPPDHFRAQIAHLRERYSPMPLRELVEAARQGSVPRGAVAVTLDDGYRDNLTNASVILSESGVPATFFVTTDRWSEAGEYWWDTLERILLSGSLRLPPELRLDLPDEASVFATDTDERRRMAHDAIYHRIVGAGGDVRDDVLRAVKRWSSDSAGANAAHRMRPDEIATLAKRAGHSIGAHSVRHLMLPRQPGPVQIEEVTQCRDTLEALLGSPVDAFAYPYGAYSDETVSIVRGASFHLAVTCDPQALGTGVDPLRVPRLDVTSRGARSFESWLAGAVAPLSESRSSASGHD